MKSHSTHRTGKLPAGHAALMPQISTGPSLPPGSLVPAAGILGGGGRCHCAQSSFASFSFWVSDSKAAFGDFPVCFNPLKHMSISRNRMKTHSLIFKVTLDRRALLCELEEGTFLAAGRPGP